MNQLLDLSITLTKPPPGSPLNVIATIILRCDALGLFHTGDQLHDPLEKQERDDLRWYLEEYWQWPYEGFAQRGKQVEAMLVNIGKRLYKTVFGSFEATSILQTWRLQPEAERQISFLSNIPRALSLPWELLHDEHGFLVLRTRNPVSILRRLPQSELSMFSTPFTPPLRVLLVTARPDEAGFIDPRGIARELLDEVHEHIEQGTIAVDFLRPPTLSALRARLSDSKRPSIHILHFDGHGTFDEQMDDKDELRLSGGKQGMLIFENDEGKRDLVKADDLALVLQDSGVRLAVLTACQSAMGSEDDAFSSVAARLIRGGVDAVAAMSASVLVASATRYVEAFYRELAKGMPAATAQERARQALHDDPRRHIHRRSGYKEGKPVELHDWWLPHFYQQRPLALQPTMPSHKRKKQQTSIPISRMNTEMPTEPRYGFGGRARELLTIERSLLHSKMVVISGFGGVGKTAVAREAADWFTRTGMYDRACFISFEHGEDATWLLSTLGTYLGIYDSQYNPSDKEGALARLKPALKKQRTLMIADNLESILPNGDVPLESAIRVQLWDVLLELAKMGAGVLLTSRNTAFGDGRLMPGKQVVHLALGGLSREDAYVFATRLLTDLFIDRKRVPYSELRELLAQLDYHPLAMQLVLPKLHELPLSEIAADFARHLPTFADDTTIGRNRSLLASLDYSLRRLNPEQQALLPRLAIFQGGVIEEALLKITEIPEAEWVRLRPTLEQAALLVVEQTQEDIAVLFLRFHPVLAPYLRSLPGADDVALRERYAQEYCSLADYLYREDKRNPQAVRELVRRELPNLRYALELLLKAGDLDAASDMVTSIARFLNFFGLNRERDELRRQVTEAGAAYVQQDGMLTDGEWLRESGLGEDELRKGNIHAAYTRFSILLEHIKALPENTASGRGSNIHCLVLGWLADCLAMNGQPAAAEEQLREALTIISRLIRQQPADPGFIRHRGALLASMGEVLGDQGKYPQAREACEEALEVAEQQGDLKQQANVLTKLGALAAKQGSYAEAQSFYTTVLDIVHTLGEPVGEAGVWHDLGNVALLQQGWVEAERCYRQALAIFEQLDDIAHAAAACDGLSRVAQLADRPTEAESWCKRALELDEQVHPDSHSVARDCTNLAYLLLNEVRAGRAPLTRLAEARSYAERALAIRKTLGASLPILTLHVLADIADLEGRAETARDYRRLGRETYVADARNRYDIDRQYGSHIATIVAATKGNAQARAEIEAMLSEAEASGWHISSAVERICAGERNWHSLVEELDGPSALLVLRVLETLAQSTDRRMQKQRRQFRK